MRHERIGPTSRWSALSAGAFLFLASSLSAADLHVDGTAGDDGNDAMSWPQAVASIVRALEVALVTPGADTIHVAAGTYPENVMLSIAGTRLLGGYPSGGGSRDPATNPTILDGGGVAPPLVVSLDEGRTVLTGIEVDGFTLTNGIAFERGIPFGGAGVFIEETEIVLTNNVITGNNSTGGGRGGGLYMFRQTAGDSIVRDNVIDGNVAEDGLGGGATLVDFSQTGTAGTVVFSNNTVSNNRASALTDIDPDSDVEPNGQGGGVWIWGGSPVISGNTIRDNVADSSFEHLYNGQGGGLFVLDAAPTISSNVILNNRAETSAAGAYAATGGGAYFLSTMADDTGGGVIVENEIRGNSATGADGSLQGSGGGLLFALFGDSDPLVTNNLIAGNSALGGGANSARGGGLYAYVGGPDSSFDLALSTLEENQAADSAGGLWLAGDAILADGLVLRANESDFASGALVSGALEIRNSRIFENRLYDPDGDMVSEIEDNCPGVANPVQDDADADGLGNDCDDDDDDDGVEDTADNCPLVANPGQGDVCAGDSDGDGIADGADNCVTVPNAMQDDATSDGVGDVCEPARFNPLATDASGIWAVGEPRLTNLLITENVGHGLELVGFAEDQAAGLPEVPTMALLTNVTIARNVAAGFVTYLANGSELRDSISAENLFSDGFDTEKDGMPSSPGMTCNGFYFGDGTPPCSGTGNLGQVLGQPETAPRFAVGPRGDYYLAQASAGQADEFIAVDAGTRSAGASPVASLTTRTDEVADSGTVDMGYHYPIDDPISPLDPLETALRVGKDSASIRATLTSTPPSLLNVRYYRGELNLLWTEYSHVSPFSGQPGEPECSVPTALAFSDTSALGDLQNWYYLAVPLDGGSEGHFGSDSSELQRVRPEDDGADRVIGTCP